MGNASNIPLVRLFIPFIAGIVAAIAFNLNVTVNEFIFFSLSLFLISIFVFRYYQSSYDKRWVSGVPIFIFLFLAGNSITGSHDQLNRKNHYSHFIDSGKYSIIEIIEPVSERQNSFRATGRVSHVLSDTAVYKTIGKVLLYFEKDSLAASIDYGDRIIAFNRFSEVRSPQNPYQFNYKRHLAFENIYFQAYISKNQYKTIATGKGNMLKAIALQYRQKALETLHKYNIHDREFAVVSALLLGYRDYIDEEMQQQFAGAGAMHILCVSGLHVGVIYLIINMVLSFLNRVKYGKKLKMIITILLIWFYAALTGFSPSVMRASTMFSFVAFAKSSNRHTNIYNILAASAFVLTIIDPYIITKIGFQLSYLAVISIVALQPHMYNMLYFKNKILDKAWAITTVSIAAQAATGPLAIYYFNQFPNFFILTNLVVIPLASVIIYTALVFLFLSPIGIIAELIGKVLSFFVFMLHKSVQMVDSLPYSSMQNINISFYETFLIFAIVILVSAVFLKRSKFYFASFLFVLLVLITSFSFKSINHQKQIGFTIYSINNHTAIDFIYGQKSVFIVDKDVIEPESRHIDFNIVQNRINKGIKEVNTYIIENDTTTIFKPYFWKKNDYILFNDTRIKILREFDKTPYLGNSTIELDYLIVSRNPEVEIEQLLNKYSIKKIIFDSSNSFWNNKRWKDQCRELGVEFWSIRNQGAYKKFY